jgi:hypothetical protein
VTLGWCFDGRPGANIHQWPRMTIMPSKTNGNGMVDRAECGEKNLFRCRRNLRVVL